MIDIVEVGAGGSTIAWLDDGNNLQVGPRSAGALPGPVCYGRGGGLPTVTDAYAVLGRLASLLGGGLPLDVEAAGHALGEKVARPLGMTVDEAASGVLEINDTRAADLLREMTIARGRDPRDFTLIAFGGAGPLVAAYVAREVGMELAVIPPAPGNFSAAGLLLADVVHDAMRTYTVALGEADPDRVGSLLEEMSLDLGGNLDRQGVGEDQRRFELGADLRYTGQFHVINIPISAAVNEASLEEMARAFHGEHQRLFTYQLPEEPLELVNLRVRAVGALGRPAQPRLDCGDSASALRGTRRVYFHEEGDRVDCPIYDRSGLGAGAALTGPAILEETTSTTLVPPGCRASVDDYGNILIRTGA
jgi:N-methylhydantoinase A